MSQHALPQRLALALLATAALAVGGCGEHRSFIAEYNKAVESLDLTPDPHDDPAGGFDRIASQLHAFRMRISALDPPSAAGAPFNHLLSAVDRYDADLRRAADATRSGDLGRLRHASNRLTHDTRALGQAEQAVAAVVDG
jgi:hypothetical protein